MTPTPHPSPSELGGAPPTSPSLAELIANASLEIAPRERIHVGAVADALPKQTGIYVPAPASRPLADTLEAIGAVRHAGLDPVPHIAARRFGSRAELNGFLDTAVRRHGVRRVLLIAGDEARPLGPYRGAVDVLEDGVLSAVGVREVGIAGYPEGHTGIPTEALDAALSRKLQLARQQQIGSYIVTQFSFSPARILACCADLARRAPGVPVYVGIAGPAEPAVLMRYARRCGVSDTLRAMPHLGANMAGLATHTDPLDQLLSLAHHCDLHPAHNIVGIHLYSFGGTVRSAHWLQQQLQSPGRH